MARLSVARLQSAGVGSGLETKRSILGAHFSVDSYSWTTTAEAAAAVGHIVKYLVLNNTKTGYLLSTWPVSSPPDQRQSTLARALERSAAHPARLFAAAAGSWRSLEYLRAQ